MSNEERGGPGLVEVDVNEYGGKKDGERQSMDRRLFMQLLVWDAPPGGDIEEHTAALIAALEKDGMPGVLYEDANAPGGIGLLTWSEDAQHFVTRVRALFRAPGVRGLVPRPGFTMLGRTYSVGYEPDLEHALLHRFVDNATNPAWRWGVWYPLRRNGAFARLDHAEQAAILREHAAIGMAYGRRDLAHDVRLACHGLDAEDNEFVIGLISDNLHRCSHLVQRMRSTVQTSEYIVKMGPFFVGHARWQKKASDA
ncbi:MAG: chlorite dismutase family protein [Myxococcales bacterium]|nr:chlorite dismutase family protein [Myxococcales bacterium]